MATGLKFQGRRLGHCRERKSLPAPRNTMSTLEVGCLNSFCLFLGLGGVNSLAGLTFFFTHIQGSCNEGQGWRKSGRVRLLCPNHFDCIACSILNLFKVTVKV